VPDLNSLPVKRAWMTGSAPTVFTSHTKNEATEDYVVSCEWLLLTGSARPTTVFQSCKNTVLAHKDWKYTLKQGCFVIFFYLNITFGDA